MPLHQEFHVTLLSFPCRAVLGAQRPVLHVLGGKGICAHFISDSEVFILATTCNHGKSLVFRRHSTNAFSELVFYGFLCFLSEHTDCNYSDDCLCCRCWRFSVQIGTGHDGRSLSSHCWRMDPSTGNWQAPPGTTKGHLGHLGQVAKNFGFRFASADTGTRIFEMTYICL